MSGLVSGDTFGSSSDRGDFGVLWTTALLAAALMQSPESGSAASDVSTPAPIYNDSASNFTPQWFSIPTASHGQQWGFENFWPRAGINHKSQGYGYDSGYTSFDTFIPLYQEDFSKLTAFQGNFILDNYGDVGFNAGLVHRHHVDTMERIFGGNIFYTNRQQGGNSFNQVGFGVETLGNYLDWRANAYIPIGDDFQLPNSGGGVTDAFFSGRSILVNFIADKPLTGFDTEVGGTLPGSLEMFRGYMGFYHFQGDYSDDVWGYQGRMEARLRDAGVASVAVTNDGTFGTNVVFGIGLWLPGSNPRNPPWHGRAASRLAEDVVRNQNIIIDRSPTKEPVTAKWLNGRDIEVVHIDSGSALPGLGTPNLPVQTLTAGQAIAGPEAILFVHANSQYTGEGVVLQNGQMLLGEGVEHNINSLYGSFILPTVTPPEDIAAVPTILAAPGDAVTLASGNVVSGFQIFGSGGNGIAGNNILNAELTRLNVSGSAGNGVVLDNAVGTITVADNFVNNNGLAGIDITIAGLDRANTLTISDNTVLQNAGEGIAITTKGQSANTLVMERNLVRVVLGPTDDRTLPLVEITASDSSRINARIENNDIEDSFNRDDTSPDEDPYYHQLTVTAEDSSRVDLGLINNRLVSDRQPFGGNPRNGSFGVDLNSTDLSTLRARLDTNSSSLNYAFSENYISQFQLEDTLSTNTGTLYYFPTANFIETIPDGTLDLPE